MSPIGYAVVGARSTKGADVKSFCISQRCPLKMRSAFLLGHAPCQLPTLGPSAKPQIVVPVSSAFELAPVFAPVTSAPVVAPVISAPQSAPITSTSNLSTGPTSKPFGSPSDVLSNAPRSDPSNSRRHRPLNCPPQDHLLSRICLRAPPNEVPLAFVDVDDALLIEKQQWRHPASTEDYRELLMTTRSARACLAR
jgi:hypothetical protein